MPTQSRDPATTIFVALAVGFVVIVLSLSYPAIVFKGPLLQALPVGLGLGLVSATLLGLGGALGSSYPGSISLAQAAPTVMIGAVVAQFLQTAAATMPAQAMLATAIALMAVSALLSGVLLLLIGRFQLANLIRYMPLPVIAGILAGSGWLLLATSISASIGKPTAALLQASVQDWCKVGLALTAAFVLWALDRLRPRPMNLPCVLLALLGGFWLTATLAGLSPAGLHARGWLMPTLPDQALWSPAGQWATLQQTDWLAIVHMLPLLLVVAIVNAFAFMVYNSGIEQATETDINLNRDAGRMGLANVLTGLLGGMPGFQNSSLSIMTYRLGVPMRFVGVGASLACLVLLLIGGDLLAYLPKVLAGAMLAYLGMNLMQEWLRAKTRLMPLLDRAVVLLVFLSVIFLGFIQALVVGVMAGIGLFVVRYSGISAARNILTGANCQSSTERHEAARGFLNAHGHEIMILRLHGFIFFGSANRLVALIEQRSQQPELPPLRHLVLDMRLVSGLDVSAMTSFAKLERHARRRGFTLLFGQTPSSIEALLRSGLGPVKPDTPTRLFASSDQALEWAENQQLQAAGLILADAVLPFEDQARKIFAVPSSASLLSYFDALELADGTVLSDQGDDSTDMYFIERGQVAVLMAAPAGPPVRLSLMGPGALVGEVAFYRSAQRSASLVTQGPTRLWCLTRTQLERMQHESPTLAAALHSHIARALANKLVELHRLVNALNQ